MHKVNSGEETAVLPTPEGTNSGRYAKSYALKAGREGHIVEALVESTATCPVLKAAREGYIVEALVESAAKCHVLKAAAESHTV